MFALVCPGKQNWSRSLGENNEALAGVNIMVKALPPA
jgi:hypothetical protein